MRALMLGFSLILAVSVVGWGCAGSSSEAERDPTGTTGQAPTDHDLDGFHLPEDCDDDDTAVNPQAQELCDGIDNNCDGLIDGDDADDPGTWYLDLDADGYGDPTGTALGCTVPVGYASNQLDCDDSDAAINPATEEICGNGIDDDCDGGAGSCGVSGMISAATAGLILSSSISGERAGVTVARAGDVNGDGLEDLLIGASSNGESAAAAGAVYLIHGGDTTGAVALADADARFFGEDAYNYLGTALAGAGDVNHDGFADLLIGAPLADVVGTDSGVAYLIYGPVEGDFDLAGAGARLEGETPTAAAGCALAGAGDVNGDGYDDILIGAKGADDPSANDVGAVYLLYGPLSGTLNLESAGALLTPDDEGDTLGSSVSSAGDFNGDGYDDIAAGVPSNTEDVDFPGSIYLFMGRPAL